MKAWRLDRPGGTLEFLDVPDPQPRPSAVLVRLQASPLLSYLKTFVAGGLEGYQPPPGPFTPGTNGIGVIAETGSDVYGLEPGQPVMLSPHVVANENVPEPAEALIGLTAEPPSAALLASWPDGTLAEFALAPAMAVTPIPAALRDTAPTTLAAISRCTVPYGGLLRTRLSAGETVIIHGATGAFGSAAVSVALAMGAARVVAAGRNADVLERLGELPRVYPVRMSGERAADTRALRDAAGGGADCALDMIGRADSSVGTLAVFDALGREGRLVLMGSMTVPLELNYADLLRTGREVLGNFMYPPQAPLRLLKLVAAGQLDLARIPVTTYPLAKLMTAMDEAERPGADLIVMT
jgi:alcohol dehydrogenase